MDKYKLKHLGYKYSQQYSSPEYACYVYHFPVATHKGTPTLFGEIRVYLDNGEIAVDVYNAGFNTLWALWYNDKSQKLVKKVDRKIDTKLKLLKPKVKGDKQYVNFSHNSERYNPCV